MIDAFLHVLGMQTLVLSVAALVIGAMRGATTRRFGAEAAYLAWALLPIALVAAALPHRARETPLLPAALDQLVPAWPVLATRPASGIAPETLLLVAWALGAAMLAAAIAWRQRRFTAQLIQADRLPAGGGPAVLGVVRPRIVLPIDFEARFDAVERGLMLAHERVHLRRRDNAWNLLACAIAVLHWFNPLAWLAWRWMRFDQELSCDAVALRDMRPDVDAALVRVYAVALLKVQGVSLRPPLATSWQSTHPLVERVRMLKHHALSSSRLRAGRRLVALAIVLAGTASYALQPPAEPGRYTTVVDDGHVNTAVTLSVDGRPPWHVVVPDDASDVGHIRFQAQAEVGLQDWLSLRLVAKPLADGRVQISSEIADETTATVISRPVVLARLDDAARIELGDVAGKHVVTITYVAQASGHAAFRMQPDHPAPPAPVLRPDTPPTDDPPAPPQRAP